MTPTVKNVIIFIAAAIIGGMVNMAIITYGPAIIPYPEGVDLSTPESYNASIDLLKAQHFIVPFIAHALGTLSGAFLVGKFGGSHWKKLCIGIAVFFLIGGIAACFMIKAPAWFCAVDLLFAYIPMGLLGWKLSGSKI